MKFLDQEWSKQHLASVKKKAGHRYTEELNVDLPIAEIFDGLARTKVFYTNIRTHCGKLYSEFRGIPRTYPHMKIQKAYEVYASKVENLLDILTTIKSYSTDNIPWNRIHSLSEQALTASWKLLRLIEVESEKPESNKPLNPSSPNVYPRTLHDTLRSNLHNIRQTQSELRFFSQFSEKTSALVSNKPYLLINGLPGSGKTHLLCDLVKHRTEKEFGATILTFGEFFEGTDKTWNKIARQLGLDAKFWDKEKILKKLDSHGKTKRGRSVLMIDALNESRPLDYWKKNLIGFCNDIKKYPNISLVITIRSGFENEVLPKKLKTFFVQEEHRGFEFKEWEAITKFFKEFSLPLPEIPLLTPEFQNPLFLLLFCKAFQSVPGGKKPKSFKGHEGATHIFEKYVDNISKKIETQFGIDHGQGKNIWDTIIELVAERMVIENVDRLPEQDLLALVKKSHPKVDAGKLLAEIEKNFLLVKVPHYVPADGSSDGFDYRFPFQKFSDHLIGRFLFKKYEKEFSKTNKNLATAKLYFSKRRKLGKFLTRYSSRGIIEALYIQCPEQLKGIEFFEVAPYVYDSTAVDAFIESIVWRRPTAFASDLKEILKFIKMKVVTSQWGESPLLNAFLSVAPVKDHPFNAEYIHSQLAKMTMAKRDAAWSTFLHGEHKERNSVDRLLEWSWSDQDISHLSDDSVFLLSIILAWFLSTPNRFVRDKATKGLVSILENRIHLVKDLLEKFKNIDDPYIQERILAAAYACVLRNKTDAKNIKSLAEYVYEVNFNNNNPPLHILTRDYARGIVEVALKRKLGIKAVEAKINPPYKSIWPKIIPTTDELKKAYYPQDYFDGKTEERGFLNIWSSVMYNFGSMEDFGNYVVNNTVGHWSNRNLKKPEKDRKVIYKKFQTTLTPKQMELLEEVTGRFKVDSSLYKFILKFRNMSEDAPQKMDELPKEETSKEPERTLSDFKKTLSSQKRKYFEKEIEPFFDDRNEIVDPLDNFSTDVAQRWILNRAIGLGYDPKLHGKFDNNVNRYDNSGRSSHKAERIGKKYQWIAFHEFLALVADNFKFKDDYWRHGDSGTYKGPWSPHVRDIDPTFLLKNDKSIKAIASFSNWKKNGIDYTTWKKIRPVKTWLQSKVDLPDPKKVIEIKDDNGKEWLNLQGMISWQEETPPEYKKYDVPFREIFYIVKGFIVRNKDYPKMEAWLLKKGFGNWLPESSSVYETFIGEYPNSVAFEDFRGDYNIWTTSGENAKEINVPVVVADDIYLNEFTLDCSYDGSVSIHLPSKWLVNGMKLDHKHLDGRFYNKKGEVVAYATSAFEEAFPSALLIDKKSLVDFLKKEDCTIFWTLLGEKLSPSPDSRGKKWKGRLNITGVYSLDGSGKVKGKISTEFEKPQ